MSLRTFGLPDGVRIAFQEWGSQLSPKKVVALHGWQDNSNSFYHLGPRLAENGYHCIALDTAGHGFSSHLSKDSSFYIHKYVSHIRQVHDILGTGWEKPHIIGHSLGAGISMMFAGCYPEKVDKLVLIDGFGPVTRDESTAASNLRKGIDAEINHYANSVRPLKQYKELNDVINSRVKICQTYPGDQYLSREAATQLMMRGARLVDDPENYTHILDSTAGPVTLRNDKKLTLPSHAYFTNNQVMCFAEAISSQTLLLEAQNGWPDTSDAAEFRLKTMVDKGVLSHVNMIGSHHLHMDPETAPAVADTILTFLSAQSEAEGVAATVKSDGTEEGGNLSKQAL